MSADSNNLDDLRAEIDTIDDSLHDLIMRRAEVVSRVKEAKQDARGGIFRPGREAQVLRRLVDRHRGDVPKPVIIRIWRELISAFVSMQGEFKIAVWDAEDPAYWDIARDHFGSQTPLTRHATTRSVLQAVADGSATAGVLPLPQIDEADPWWPLLGNESNGRQVRVCARLPFASEGNGRGGRSEALLVADITPVETGDDRSFMIIECAEPISRSRLTGSLSSAGLTPTALVTLPKSGAMMGRELFLIEIDGFAATDDSRVAQFVEDNEDFSMARIVGGYAVPLSNGG
ncbi:MAG: chorismate mutase [Alphaproteobacteria bacterium]|nr:chorismate mutase [Alphaproteobacteria bacterium]